MTLVIVGVSLVTAASASATLNWGPPAPLDHSSGLQVQSVSCPTATQCTGVDPVGHAVTFNPASPAGAASVYVDSAYLYSVSCPAADQCTAVDLDGREVTFNPETSVSGPVVQLSVLGVFYAVACSDVNHCTAAGRAGSANQGLVVTFDPKTGSHTSVAVGSSEAFQAVACASSSVCDAVDGTGTVYSYNPADPANVTHASVAPGHGATAVACSSTSLCTLVDGSGDAYSFNASAPGTGPTHASVDPGGQTTAIACSSASQCVVVDVAGNEIKINPQNLSAAATAHPVDSHPLTSVACTPDGQCTTVDGEGAAVTFNPTSPGTPAATVIDTGAYLGGLACVPSGTQCTATDGSTEALTFNPDSPAGAEPVTLPSASLTGAIACPSAGECIAGESGGQVVIFDPASAASASQLSLGLGNINQIACPSTTQCTVVDGSPTVVTFNPATQVAMPSLSPTGFAAHRAPEIQCPSTGECVLAGLDATGTEAVEATFDPTSSTPPAAAQIAGQVFLGALGCPSASECLATGVDTSDADVAVTFNPMSPAVTPTTAVSEASIISCPGANFCALAGDGGTIGEGDPAVGNFTYTPITFGPVTGLSCTSPDTCVAVDGGGDMILGQLPAPVNSSPPTISGDAVEGQKLTEAHGGWSNSPTSYSIQWQQCDSGGNSCQPISGATGQTYTLAAGDVGHTIRVSETASNVGGTAGPVSSAPTGVVTAPPPPPPPASGPTTAQILALLLSEIAPHGRNAHIRALAKHRGYSESARALLAGKLTISWYLVPKGAHVARARHHPKPTLVATGTVTYSRAGTATLKIKLTKQGRKLLKHARKLTLTGKGSFRPSGKRAITARKTFKLTH